MNSFYNGERVRTLCREGRLKEALILLKGMLKQNGEATTSAYVGFLKECGRKKALAEGKQVHALMVENRFELNIFVANHLVDMYSKCGSLLDAHTAFCAIPQHNVFSWTTIISAYANSGKCEEAVDLFQKMQKAGIAPDKVTFTVALKACARIPDLEKGKQLHSLMLEKGFQMDVIAQSALVDMYARCGCLEDARQIFNSMRERDVVSWTAMIAGYVQNGLGREALFLFERMEKEGVQANKVTYIVALKACASIAAVDQGKQIHSMILKRGLGLDLIAQNTLVDMYAKCGCLENARELFNSMKERDGISWTALIAGHVRNWHGKEALGLYEQMNQEGVQANKITFAAVLKACASIGALEQGRQLHSLIVERGFHLDVTIQNALMDMYAKCGCLEDAREVFENMSKRDVISWNVMIAGYAQNELGMEALALFEQMNQEDVEANKVTYIVVLKACASIAALEKGKRLHFRMLERGFELDVTVQNILVDMYAKCGSLVDAWELFKNMGDRDVVSWNAMIAGYAQNGFGMEALSLYEQMKHEGVEADKITFVIVLKACAGIAALEQGKQLHSLIITRGLELDPILQNTLVDMYTKCGSLEDARGVFNNMGKRDVVSWNVMISGYAQNGLGKEALALFEQMKREGVQADKVTFTAVIKACASIAALEKGKQIHSVILRRGFGSDLILQTALVDMYAKCGCLQEARQVFDSMSERDVVSWNAMIAGYAQIGLGSEALLLYEQMTERGLQVDKVTLTAVLKACASIVALEQGKQIHFLILKSGFELDEILKTTLIDMYVKCGCIEDARQLFNNMSEQSIASWNAMIAGYVQNGLGNEALLLYEQMEQEGVQADKVTFTALITACASIAALEQGKHLHSVLLKRGFRLDVILQSALLDMYARCGSLEDARELFNNMSKRDVGSWTAMIAGYAQNGLGTEALALYDQMRHETVQPSEGTYICVLSACSHAGLVEEGWDVFDSMMKDSQVTPTWQLYSCMVDLLGRAGCLAKAEDLIMKMPMQPDITVWMSLLGAARNHGDMEIGRRAFDSIVNLEPRNTAAYQLLIDIYEAAGRMDEAAHMRKEMKVQLFG